MPMTKSRIEEVFGVFRYEEDQRKRGAIKIDPGWQEKNIVRIATLFGSLPVHRLAAYQIGEFLRVGYERGLIHSCAGIFVPRHKMWDPDRDLSDHSWGIAVDVNADEGLDGRGGEMNISSNSFQPPELIELGREYGLECGTEWRGYKDGMHFTCIHLVLGDSRQPVSNPALDLNPEKLPVLRLGEKGCVVEIKELQLILNAKIDCRLKVDGVFGKATKQAVEKFQVKHNLKADGIVGPMTWEYLLNH